MADRRSHTLGDSAVVHGVFSDRTDGDLAPDAGDMSALQRRRAALAPVPWTWLHQVHSAGVVEVTHPGDRAGETADASVTRSERTTLSVQVADCAPVLMFAPTGDSVVLAAVHAGWRGLLEGVLPATVEAMRGLGAEGIQWWLGPCVSAPAYEFSPADLEVVSSRLGDGVRSTTPAGAPALDMVAAVEASMALAGVSEPHLGPHPRCTATGGAHFSHRARGETSRQVGAIWWERST